MVNGLVIGMTPGALGRLGGAITGRDRRSRGDLGQEFNQHYFFVALAVEGSSQRFPIDQLHLGVRPRVLAHDVGSKGSLRLCQSNLRTVFPINRASTDVELGLVVSEAWDQWSMRWVRSAKDICLPISFHIQLCRKIKGFHTMPLILMTFNMAKRIGPANQFQSFLNFIPNILIGLQRGVRKSFSILGILKDRRQ
jgi:hypothetical protein